MRAGNHDGRGVAELKSTIAVGVVLLVAALILPPDAFRFGRLPIDERGGSYVTERYFNAWCVRNHHLPLWNPYSFFGTPHIANHQSAFFYPPNFLYVVMSPPTASKLIAVLHYFLAGVFTALLLGRLGCGAWGAAAGGLVFMASGYLMSHEGHTALHNSAVWAPLVFYFVEGIVRGRARWNFAGGAVAFAMLIFAGYMHVAVLVSGMVALYAIVYWIAGRGRRRWTVLAIAILMLAWGGLLAAVQVFTSLEVVKHTPRPSLTYEEFSSYFLPISHLPLGAFPLLFGGCVVAARPLVLPYAGMWNLSEVTCWSGGMVAAVLAGAGFWYFRRGSRRHSAWGWLTVGALAGVLSLGPQLPVYRMMYHVPVYNMFRSPGKNLLHVHLAIAVLAGLGVHGLAMLARRRLRAFRQGAFLVAAVTAAGAFAMVALILIVKLLKVESWPGVATSAFWTALAWKNPAVWMPITAAVGNAAILALWAATRRTGFLLLCAVLLVIHAGFVNRQLQTDSTDMDIVYDHPERNVTYKYLKDTDPDFETFRYYPIIHELGDGIMESFFPCINIPYGLRSLAGYGPLFPRSLAEVLGMTTTGIIGDMDRRLAENHILSSLNVKYLTVWPRRESYDRTVEILETTRLPNGDPAYALRFATDGNVRLYENLGAVPRIFSVERLYSVPPETKKRDAYRASVGMLYYPPEGFDPANEAILSERFPKEMPSTFTKAKIRWRSHGPNKIRIKVTAPGDAFVVIVEPFFPGWDAWMDGERVKTFRVNGLVTGIHVPPGFHRILYRYRPKGFRAGLGVSLAAAGVLGIFCGLPRRWSNRLQSFLSRLRLPTRRGGNHA